MTRRSTSLILVLALVAAVLAACSSPLATPGPTATNGPAAADQLAATLPTSVNGVTLQTKALSAAELTALPGYEMLVAGLNNLFKTPDDLLVATATDPTGASDLRILALRIIGEDTGRLGLAMSNWAATTSGATVTQTNVGRPVTQVDQPGKPTVYYYVTGDTVYMVQTADKTLASAALTQLP